MKIKSVAVDWLQIPLASPVSVSNRLISDRDYVLVRVKCENGVEGIGACLDGILSYTAAKHILAPMLIGRDIFDVKQIWDTMFRATIQQGRRGSVMRAISAIDIALWDAMGKATGKPLYKLLGAFRERAPCYASGGYYRSGNDLDTLLDEMRGYMSSGFKAVKMRVGGRSPAEDIARLAAVRATVGDDIDIMLDANQTWTDLPSALAVLKPMERYRPFWIEEPVQPDSFALSAELRRHTSITVATGEVENTRWGFQMLKDTEAAAIWQPDVAVVGGITEWMRVADLATASNIPLTPHYWWDIHIHLACACDNVLLVEYFTTDEIVCFDKVLTERLTVRDGMLRPPQRPGIGWQIDEEQVNRYRKAD